MTLAGKTIAITGAARGLGAALAIVAADRGMLPLLLGRNPARLAEIAGVIEARTGRRPDCIACDLADLGSVADAAAKVALLAPELDILVNSGSQWTGGAFEAQTDEQIASVVNSTVSGTMALTRRLLPLLRARPAADIHTVVSMSGLPYPRMRGSSVPFVAAKAAQNGFVQALTEELMGTRVRVTSVYPGIIEDVLPTEPAWDHERGDGDMLSDRNVVEAILYVLDQPANVAIRSLVIERAQTDFLR
ncbi:SDR family oxidoreductase [Devosia sp.]|uniref:SDR family oxidoreductase n=1 Tax=Devosia sp. TaxID=1871048 RepID=UPI002FCB8A31